MGGFDLPSTSSVRDIVIVDDEPMMADLLCEWVKEKWNGTAFNDGSEALEHISESTDLILLDRQMPGLSGEEVLKRIRERIPDMQVLMVSGVRPDFDILELPFDDYCRKPVDRSTIQEAIESLLLRRSYHPNLQEFFAAMAKIELLESVMPPEQLASDNRYLSLRTKADQLRQDANATLGSRTSLVEQFHDIEADD